MSKTCPEHGPHNVGCLLCFQELVTKLQLERNQLREHNEYLQTWLNQVPSHEWLKAKNKMDALEK